jgi:hypothetical protein
MNPLSGVIGEAWQMYRAHAARLLLIAFVVYLVAAILDGLVSAVGGLVVSFFGLLISLLAAFLVQAALVKAVQDMRDGRADLSLREVFSAAAPSILPVAVASILGGIAITIGFAVFIIPGLILITIWAVIVPVIVIERTGALGSFGRSWNLVRGHAWHVFGTLVIVFVIMFVVNIILSFLLSALTLETRNGVATVLSGTLVAPFLAIVVTQVYYRLAGLPASTYGTPPSGSRRR